MQVQRWLQDNIEPFPSSFSNNFQKAPGKQKEKHLDLLAGVCRLLHGNNNIAFYYLKHQLHWDAAIYGYLSASIYALNTLAMLFLYPLLKHQKVADTIIAEIGLTCRLLGRIWLAIVFNTWTAFILVGFDMFGRFGSAALRSLLSQQVPSTEQGKIFAVISIVDALTTLLAAVTFNSLFPATLSFFPQFSFILMAVLMIIPVFSVWSVHLRLESPSRETAKDEETEML